MRIRETARIKYEEGEGEFRDAKRKAARRFGAEKALCPDTRKKVYLIDFSGD